MFVCFEFLILSFAWDFFAYLKFHSDWGWVIAKFTQNELDYRDTAPLTRGINKKAAKTGANKRRQVSVPILHASDSTFIQCILLILFFSTAEI